MERMIKKLEFKKKAYQIEPENIPNFRHTDKSFMAKEMYINSVSSVEVDGEKLVKHEITVYFKEGIING